MSVRERTSLSSRPYRGKKEVKQNMRVRNKKEEEK